MSEQPTSLFSESGATSRYPDLGSPSDTRPTKRPLVWNAGADLGLLLLRFGVGGTFIAHGLQHVFGLWGGPGSVVFGQQLGGYGFAPAGTLAWVTGVGELVGGVLVILGLLTPLAAAGLLAIMINVVLLKLGNGFFLSGVAPIPAALPVPPVSVPGTPVQPASPALTGGFEFELLLGLAAAALVLAGPGRLALDNGRPWHRRPASWGVLCLVIGIAAAVLVRILLHH